MSRTGIKCLEVEKWCCKNALHVRMVGALVGCQPLNVRWRKERKRNREGRIIKVIRVSERVECIVV